MIAFDFQRKFDGTIMHIALGDFANLVHDNKYDKMDYHTWRDLMRNKEDLQIKWGAQTATVAPLINITTNDGEKIWTLKADDNSFGQFLYENYLEEYEKMIQTNSSNISGGFYDSVNTQGTLSYDTRATPISNIRDTSYPTLYLNTTSTTSESTIKKENVKMKAFNFDFGPVKGNVVRMSMYGLAVKNKTGTYVSYNVDNDEIMDVDIFNFDGAQFLYKMPVAIKDIAAGDVVVHQNIPMFVVEVPTDGKTLYAVDPVNGEKKEIMLTRSPFGFNFATKVVNFLGGMFNGSATAENPFGNMWMLMAMGDNQDMNSMLPMMMMAQGGAMDPTAMMMLMAMKDKDGDSNDMLPLMFAMQSMAKPAATGTHVCNCNGNCGNHEG